MFDCSRMETTGSAGACGGRDVETDASLDGITAVISTVKISTE